MYICILYWSGVINVSTLDIQDPHEPISNSLFRLVPNANAVAVELPNIECYDAEPKPCKVVQKRTRMPMSMLSNGLLYLLVVL